VKTGRKMAGPTSPEILDAMVNPSSMAMVKFTFGVGGFRFRIYGLQCIIKGSRG
jgi:hypothetical protein